MKIHYLFFSICYLLLPALLGCSVTHADGEINQASVLVADESESEQNRGIKQALAQVLVKFSGSRSIVIEPAIKQALARPLNFLSQYGYANDDGRLMLNAEFDFDAVNDFLLENSLPIWIGERPVVLLWLAVESEGSRRVVAEGSHPTLQAIVEENMQRRGLPHLLPLLDLDDRKRVSVTDVWGGFVDIVEAASNRYSPGAVVVGRLFPVAGGWSAHWSLVKDDGSIDSWDSQGASLDNILASSVDVLADNLGRLYATKIDNSRRAAITLSINNISGAEDYARALNYLESLQFVDRVSIHEVHGPNVSFIVQYKGQLDDVRFSIQRGKVLRENSVAQFSFNYDTLSYSLIQ